MGVAGGESADDVRQAAPSKLTRLRLGNLRHGVALTTSEAFSESAIDAHKRLVSGVSLSALHFAGLGCVHVMIC